jgi:mono/diheme cytochrome c family protein
MGGRVLNRLGFAAAWVALVAFLAAPGPSAAGDPRTAERGGEIVRRQCGGCHAAGRTGDSPLPAAPPLRELHRRYEPEALAEALAEGILTGHPAMPAFRFEPQDVRAIIRYLNDIQDRQPS